MDVPALEEFAQWYLKNKSRPISTTMAFVRSLDVLLKNKSVGKYIVPIIADEARTFGMEGLFRQIGIYNRMDKIILRKIVNRYLTIVKQLMDKYCRRYQ